MLRGGQERAKVSEAGAGLMATDSAHCEINVKGLHPERKYHTTTCINKLSEVQFSFFFFFHAATFLINKRFIHAVYCFFIFLDSVDSLICMLKQTDRQTNGNRQADR